MNEATTAVDNHCVHVVDLGTRFEKQNTNCLPNCRRRSQPFSILIF